MLEIFEPAERAENFEQRYKRKLFYLHMQVFQIDADAIFVDMKKRLETMLEEAGAARAELVYTNDHDADVADNHSPINAGVYFARASGWTLSFFERVYTDYPEAVNHQWWEQIAVRDFRDENFGEWDEHALIIPHW